ncbi:hypothetical protein EV360DRAFT_76901 [Lentinula raphanica]|nr:hypothetical protein EV360DRAFT_76901 [Lentinula raphanica]
MGAQIFAVFPVSLHTTGRLAPMGAHFCYSFYLVFSLSLPMTGSLAPMGAHFCGRRYTQRTTKLSFDDFISDSFPVVTGGEDQGDPFAAVGYILCTPRAIDRNLIKPVTHARFLGVQMDSSLKWREQQATMVKKGQDWLNQFRRLACSTDGMAASHIRQLYKVKALPQILYAADVVLVPSSRKKKQVA